MSQIDQYRLAVVTEALRNLVIECASVVASEAAVELACLEHKALRKAYIKAIHALETTEAEVIAANRGAWKRGAAP